MSAVEYRVTRGGVGAGNPADRNGSYVRVLTPEDAAYRYHVRNPDVRIVDVQLWKDATGTLCTDAEQRLVLTFELVDELFYHTNTYRA